MHSNDAIQSSLKWSRLNFQSLVQLNRWLLLCAPAGAAAPRESYHARGSGTEEEQQLEAARARASAVAAAARADVGVLLAQLQDLLALLRSHFCYCFYCGCVYKDAEELAQQCPGLAEEDH
jgi:hypothetical protein